MSEKRKHDTEPDAMAIDETPIAAARSRVRAKRTVQFSDVYAVEDKALQKILGQKMWKQCNKITSTVRDHTVHSLHPQIRRYPVKLKFNLNPERDDAHDLRIPIENLLPQNILELCNRSTVPEAETLRESQFILHSLVVKKHHNPAPFTVALLSNMIDHNRHYFESLGDGHAWHDILTRTTTLAMPDDVGSDAFYYAEHGEHAKNLKPFFMGSHTDPDNARVFASLSPQTADNGVFFTSWLNPRTHEQEAVAICASSHIVGVIARADWEHHELRFHPVVANNGAAGNQRFLFVIPHPVYNVLREHLENYNFAALPVCDASRTFFQLSRAISEENRHWTYERQLVEGTTPEDMRKDFEVEFELELHYSLFMKEIGTRVINLPDLELKLADMNNEIEIKALEREREEYAENLDIVSRGLGIL